MNSQHLYVIIIHSIHAVIEVINAVTLKFLLLCHSFVRLCFWKQACFEELLLQFLSAESGKNEKGLPPNPKKQSPPKSKVFMVVISEREGRVNKSAS